MDEKKKKRNCWEVMTCGREPGGKNADQFGVCPVCSATASNGINSGQNGGRYCWAISGTYCNGKIQGSFVNKFHDCLNCPFYREVEEEEDSAFTVLPVVTNAAHKFDAIDEVEADGQDVCEYKRNDIVEMSVSLERYVADLYTIFSQLHEEDRIFWLALAKEEKNHAALLKTASRTLAPDELNDLGICAQKITEVGDVLAFVKDRLRLAIRGEMPRTDMFSAALKIEASAGELHFQEAMDNALPSPVLQILQNLNADDKDHEKRIREYAEKHGIL